MFSDYLPASHNLITKIRRLLETVRISHNFANQSEEVRFEQNKALNFT